MHALCQVERVFQHAYCEAHSGGWLCQDGSRLLSAAAVGKLSLLPDSMGHLFASFLTEAGLMCSLSVQGLGSLCDSGAADVFSSVHHLQGRQGRHLSLIPSTTHCDGASHIHYVDHIQHVSKSQGLLVILCLPLWCGRYSQSNCSVARFLRAADALAYLCHYSGWALTPANARHEERSCS